MKILGLLLVLTTLVSCASYPADPITRMYVPDVEHMFSKAVQRASSIIERPYCIKAFEDKIGVDLAMIPSVPIYKTSQIILFDFDKQGFYVLLTPDIIARTVCGRQVTQGQGIYINPAYLSRLDAKEILHVLLHEYAHWLHCYSGREDYKDETIRESIAEDIANTCALS